MAYPDKLNPEGPLPRGWNRITWTDKAQGHKIVYTDDVTAAVLLHVALEASPLVTPDSVTIDSWSDYPSGGRTCQCDKDDCPDH